MVIVFTDGKYVGTFRKTMRVPDADFNTTIFYFPALKWKWGPQLCRWYRADMTPMLDKEVPNELKAMVLILPTGDPS